MHLVHGVGIALAVWHRRQLDQGGLVLCHVQRLASDRHLVQLAQQRLDIPVGIVVTRRGIRQLLQHLKRYLPDNLHLDPLQPAPCGAIMAALVLAERLPLFCLLQGCPAVDQAHGSGCHTGAGVGVQILLGGCPGGKAALFAGIDNRAVTHHAHLYCPCFPAPVDAALAVCALARLWRCRALLLFAAVWTV